MALRITKLAVIQLYIHVYHITDLNNYWIRPNKRKLKKHYLYLLHKEPSGAKYQISKLGNKIFQDCYVKLLVEKF